MCPRLAAPGAVSGGLRGGLRTDQNTANSTQFPVTLAPALINRLAAHGVRSLEDWRRLGRGRFRLWGVTRAMVHEIDVTAKAAT
jgi:hypothetical protein